KETCKTERAIPLHPSTERGRPMTMKCKPPKRHGEYSGSGSTSRYSEERWRSRFAPPVVSIPAWFEDCGSNPDMGLESQDPEPPPEPGTQSGKDFTEDEAIVISPMAFLRSMAMLAWTAFRHPFSTTVIDLSTGQIVSDQQVRL